eukprot:s1181_g14.t1
MLMKWERGIQKWSSSLVSGGNAHSDAMDVDQIGQVKGGDKGKDKGKGKGKDKGKGKGKGKGYHPQQQQYQQHYHQHYGQEKGKGKKGKDGGKHQQQWSTWSKGKGKESKGKGQGQAQQNQCRLCGQCGHWKNECWMNQHKVWAVNESEAFSQNHASIPNPSTSTAGANQQAKVKRVFCLTENADDIVDSSSASIRMLQCFTIHDAGDPFLSMSSLKALRTNTALIPGSRLGSPEASTVSLELRGSPERAVRWKIEHEGDQSWLNFEDCPHRDIERNSYDEVCDFNEQLETLESLERPLPEVMLDEPSVPTTVQQEIESDFQYSPDAPEEPMIPETPLGMPDDAELSDIAEERLEAPPAPLPGLGPDLEGPACAFECGSP